MTTNMRHALRDAGKRSPVHAMSAISAAAAMPTRASTTVNGRSSASATLAKRNDPLHNSVRASSSTHSARFIARVMNRYTAVRLKWVERSRYARIAAHGRWMRGFA
jgi:hypothetical protein